MPFGPSVDFTRSAIAIAPTNELRRACSPFSSDAPSWRTDGPPLPIMLMSAKWIDLFDERLVFWFFTFVREETSSAAEQKRKEKTSQSERGEGQRRVSGRGEDGRDASGVVAVDGSDAGRIATLPCGSSRSIDTAPARDRKRAGDDRGRS